MIYTSHISTSNTNNANNANNTDKQNNYSKNTPHHDENAPNTADPSSRSLTLHSTRHTKSMDDRPSGLYGCLSRCQDRIAKRFKRNKSTFFVSLRRQFRVFNRSIG